MSEANSGMTLHSLVLRCDSFSCNCNSNNSHCQLAPKSNSHISQSFVASVYKPAFSNVLHFNFVQQCIQISTRINSSSVHTYIFRLFYIASSIRIFILINPIIQHGVRIEAVATSLQEGESTDRIQQFPAYLLHISKHPEYFYSRITVLLVTSKKGGRQRAVQSAIVSRVFRAVLPGRIFILSGSKALQAPSAVPVHHPMHPTAFYPAETSFYVARGDQQFPVVLPCCSRRGILTG